MSRTYTTYHLATNKPEEYMRPTTLIFYGMDPEEAKQLAVREREDKRAAYLRDANVFIGDTEHCDTVWIMPTVADHHREKIKAVYGTKVVDLKMEDMPNYEPVEPVEPRRPGKPADAKGSQVRKRLAMEDDGKVSPEQLRSMTNKELRLLASRRDVDVTRAMNKEQLIAALEMS